MNEPFCVRCADDRAFQDRLSLLLVGFAIGVIAFSELAHRPHVRHLEALLDHADGVACDAITDARRAREALAARDVAQQPPADVARSADPTAAGG